MLCSALFSGLQCCCLPVTLARGPRQAELDRFCDAMLAIREEIREIEQGKVPKDNNALKNAPHTMEVGTPLCSVDDALSEREGVL